ncbi:hypothetical protein BDZ89DRAFT_1049814 [Hymenopellis radicata]|nr:hypothetical protein BDZ89DRAFT_1049814 [Hymenopellis radicata]
MPSFAQTLPVVLLVGASAFAAPAYVPGESDVYGLSNKADPQNPTEALSVLKRCRAFTLSGFPHIKNQYEKRACPTDLEGPHASRKICTQPLLVWRNYIFGGTAVRFPKRKWTLLRWRRKSFIKMEAEAFNFHDSIWSCVT